MKPTGEETPRRIADSPDDGSATSRLLRRLPPVEVPDGARARVWRKVSGAPERWRPRRWVMVPALAALAAVAVFAVSALRSGAAMEPPVLALSSGAVEQVGPARVRTGPGSRALVRVGASAVLLAEETEVAVEGAEVAVFRGRVAVATASGSPVALRAADRSVVGSGVFAAALMDSERFERVEATEEERALLQRFGRGAGPESRLRVEAPEGYAVGIDGAQVGRAPLRALVPLGARALVGRRADGAQLMGEAEVVGGRETVVVLHEPASGTNGLNVGGSTANGLNPSGSSANGSGAAAGPLSARERSRLVGSAHANAPESAAAKPRKRGPPTTAGTESAPNLSGSTSSSGVAAGSPGITAPPSPLAPAPPDTGGALVPVAPPSPLPSDVATAADPDLAAYAKAKELLSRGEPAQAAALFSDVARGHSSRAELSLYELGRTELRYLHDPAAARSAFSSYVERYPSGLLLQEVELSLIEAELAGSDFAAARASMDRFLTRHPRSERRDEVMLLRANLDRDRGDCASALERYRTLSKGAGAVADDATYFAAVCAQQLGRTEEARALLQDSLQRFPSGRHAEDARRALAGR
ncbi:MAG TPA: outer membrane protein assembly factor BamD [Myxococcaceae bacterium]|nr:outer membrane protein assembly factor BamD [Myxococcaceae bacterium]